MIRRPLCTWTTMWLIIALCSFTWISQAQPVPFRFMTYNGLKLSGDDTDRQAAFQKVFEETNPDILVMQEVVDAGGANLILEALNAGGSGYALAPFYNGFDTDNAFFYRTSLVTYSEQDVIITALREISEYSISIAGAYLRIYVAHLKAGDSPDSENKRFDEVAALRSHLAELPPDTEFLFAGDMNIYSSSEAAYQKLISDNDGRTGRFEDLIGPAFVGRWHNNASFAAVHTQSTRTTQVGGGSSGGVDDRFDIIFGSYGLNDSTGIEYLEGTYTSFGNDGQHFNKSINEGTNLSVSAETADALYLASDHLPVFADFVSLNGGSITPPVDSTHSTIVFSEIFYDTPGEDAIEEWIELYNASDHTVDLGNWKIIDNNGTGNTIVIPEGDVLEPGSYYTIANNESAFYQLYGYHADLYGSVPALNNNGDALTLQDPSNTSIDRVAWEGGASAGLPAGWNSTSQPLAVRGESLVRIDVLADSDSYTDWTIAPNNGRPDTRNVTSVYAIHAESHPPGQGPSLLQNYPNPFTTTTTIRYSISDPGNVSLTIFDLLGREVARPVEHRKLAGSYELVFDASAFANGMYIYRLQTDRQVLSRRFIVAR